MTEVSRLGPCLSWMSGSVQEKQLARCGIGWARCYPYINRLPLGGCDTELLLSLLPRVLPGCGLSNVHFMACTKSSKSDLKSAVPSQSHSAASHRRCQQVLFRCYGSGWCGLGQTVCFDWLPCLERAVLNCSRKRCLSGFGCELWASETQLSTAR